MSTSTLERPTTTPARTHVEVGTRPVTLGRVISSEWIKFRTLRSTLAVLGASVIALLAIGLIVAYNTRHITGKVQAEDLATSATMQGYLLAQLLIGALGVLFVSGEYATGMIRSTLAAVPKRIPVLWAKLIVFVTVTLAAMLASAVVTFVAAQALIGRYRTGYSLSDPGALRVVLGTAVFITLIGVIGAALGWILRSTPGALVTFVAAILVVPVIFSSLLGTWGKDIGQYLPSNAGESFIHSIHAPNTLAPWTGLAVLGLWAVAGIAIAAVQLRRRDA